MKMAALSLAACLALAACGGGGGLHRLESASGGPDEFAVQPARMLEIPDRLTLPAPTPGLSNRADPNPTAEAIAALGGRPAAAFAGGIPARDGALVAAVSRNGVVADIRSVVAQEDAAFRGRAMALQSFNLLGRDRYFQAYARQALDAQAELERFRAAGIAVPSAPPVGD